MARLHELKSEILRDGRITNQEVAVIWDHIHSDGELDISDVRFLVELLSDAKYVCPEFDKLFFGCLKRVILADGQIGSDEQFYLLKMLYSDGIVRDCERDFLMELRNEVTEVTPEFDELCDTALAAPATGWDVGGR